MKHILSRVNASHLRILVEPPALLAFDFDGTLAPIVARPGQAALRKEMVLALKRLAALYPCVVISGRSRKDLAARLKGIPLKAIIGNHGAEFEAGIAPPAQVAGWHRQIRRDLAAHAGVEIENKQYSISVHIRLARNKRAARKAVWGVATSLTGARLVRGKQVLNIVPLDAMDKGLALAHVMKRLGARRALFVGDDLTDEDVFRRAETLRVIGVRMGRSGSSSAAYYLRGIEALERMMGLLVSWREGATQPHEIKTPRQRKN